MVGWLGGWGDTKPVLMLGWVKSTGTKIYYRPTPSSTHQGCHIYDRFTHTGYNLLLDLHNHKDMPINIT